MTITQLDPQIVNVAELPQFSIAFQKELAYFVEQTGLDPELHFRYHEGQFDVKAISAQSFSLPQIVLTFGEGLTKRNGGTLSSTVSAGIYIITKEEPGIARDTAALFFINELTRFLLRKEEWKFAGALATVPQSAQFTNEYSDELDKKKLSLWVMVFEPIIPMALSRSIARFPAFTQLGVQALGFSQSIDPSTP